MSGKLPQFKNAALLTTALTHRSALNENVSTSEESNERLEFLGDAVLELATTKFLFATLPDEQEGVLTAFRSALVKTETLAQVATELDLGNKLYMSKGEEATGGRTNPGLLEDATEALIGALYLDQGFEAAETFLKENLFTKFEYIKKNKLHRDSKSLLQEVVQAQGSPPPDYNVIKEDGPDHDKEFTVAVHVEGKQLGVGSGSSKQRAQQQAARQALEKMGEE